MLQLFMNVIKINHAVALFGTMMETTTWLA